MEQKNNSKKVLWIVLVVLLVAILITAGYFIYKRQVTATEEALIPPNGLRTSSFEPKVSSKNNPQGPYYHQIYAATSSDGLTWTKQDKMLFDHASVPGAVIKNDKIYLYFVDASEDEDQLSVVTSTDNGQTFETKQKVKVQGVPTYSVVDQHPQLIDGKIRLYFFSNPMSPDSQKEPEVFKMYSALSNDGINFAKSKNASANNIFFIELPTNYCDL